MKRLVRLVAMAGLAVAASCGRTTVTPAQVNGAPVELTNAAAIPQTVHVIPFYDYGKSGFDPLGVPGGTGGFIGTDAALYGATVSGGSTTCTTPLNPSSETGCGIVYRLIPNANKRKYKLEVLYTFEGGSQDGAAAFGTLLTDKRGNIYGTTFYGGEYDEGTLFKLHPTSSGYSETILHSFGYGEDGAYPYSGVIEVEGAIYGTTVGGGANTSQVCERYAGIPNGTCGTVYRVNPATGQEHVLHSFGKVGDGSSPFAGLLDVGDTLYGTTDLGGLGASGLCGTVFSIRTGGKGERVVHNFLNATRGDGCNPFASLIDVNGTLYGTTCCGGGNFCGHCEGTLFSVDLSTGKEQVLHEFGEPGDGSEPVAAVVDAGGALYGTTTIGGSSGCVGGDGCGTIYSYVPSTSSPTYSVLYQFTGGRDGGGPADPLLYSHRELYGTTLSGGKSDLGTGVKLRL